MKSRSPDQAWIICILFKHQKDEVSFNYHFNPSFGWQLIYRYSMSNPISNRKREKNLPISDNKEMVISFTIEVSVAKKRHRLLSTVQLILYSIVIGIPVGSGQQETKISAELLWTKGP